MCIFVHEANNSHAYRKVALCAKQNKSHNAIPSGRLLVNQFRSFAPKREVALLFG